MEISAIKKRIEQKTDEILGASLIQFSEQPKILTNTAKLIADILKEKIKDALPFYKFLLSSLVEARRYEEALDIMNTVLPASSKDINFLNFQGEILQRLGRNEDALKCFEQALEMNPHDIGALVNRGMVLLKLEKYEEAQSALEQALEQVQKHKPEDSLILEILAEGLSGIASYLCLSEKYPEALDVINKTLELNPNSALSLGLRGIALRNVGFNNKALKDLEKSITLDPTLTWIHIELAKTWSEMGEYEKAVQILQEAVKLDPTLDGVYANLGENLCQLGQYQEALDALEKGLEIDPHNETIMENKAICLAELDRYSEALQTLDQASKLANCDQTFIFGLQAEILSDIAEYEKAVKILNKAIEIDSKYDQLFYLKGWILSKLERFEEAKQAYESAKVINSSNLWIHKGIAETYYLLGQPEKATKEYELIIKEAENRTDEFYFDLVGWCYYRLSQYSTAAKFFVQALSLLEPEDFIRFSIQFDLSLALMCSKRHELALQEYKKGLNMIKKQYVLKRCGVLSVALMDFEDALNNLNLKKFKQAKEILKLLEEALAEANKSKQEILSEIQLDCLTE